MDLRDELEIACIDALGGDPPGRATAGRLERACREVLHRRGVRGARVEAVSGAGGTRVTVWLPGPDRRVREVVLTLA